MEFMNKVVIITGAASAIGEVIALQFARESARLSLIDDNFNKLIKLAEKCESLSQLKVLKVVIDITRDFDLIYGFNSTLKKYGRIDILVNCASIPCFGGVIRPNALEIYDKVINVNLRATVALTHFAVDALIESKGCIINISNVLGSVAYQNGSIYCLSKAGVTHFTKCVALELADKGVRVNCISPGFVETEIIQDWGKQGGKSKLESEKVLDQFLKSVPLQREVQIKKIAELVAFLASEKARSITGGNFAIDSGFSLTTALGSLGMN